MVKCILCITDIRGINSIAVQAINSGMIIVGGGVIKHHTANANLMVNIIIDPVCDKPIKLALHPAKTQIRLDEFAQSNQSFCLCSMCS